jgi:hypothetical protein
MIVIYHDVGGSHSSITAANIHINKLLMIEFQIKGIF